MACITIKSLWMLEVYTNVCSDKEKHCYCVKLEETVYCKIDTEQ